MKSVKIVAKHQQCDPPVKYTGVFVNAACGLRPSDVITESCVMHASGDVVSERDSGSSSTGHEYPSVVHSC